MLADIPGLIEGAHEGHGLGDRFLGHVERCRVLLHLVDATGDHAGTAYRIVRQELEAYGAGIADKPEIVALSKVDAVEPSVMKTQTERLKRAIRSYGPRTDARRPPLMLSAATNKAVSEALRALAGDIATARADDTSLKPQPEWAP